MMNLHFLFILFSILLTSCRGSEQEWRVNAGWMQRITTDTIDPYKQLVMVRLDPQSSLFSSLQFDPQTLRYQMPKHFGDTALLVRTFDSVNELNDLAQQVHGDSGHCGGIEWLPFTATTTLNTHVYAPVVPDQYSHKSVNELLGETNRGNIRSNIQVLENLGTRFHTSTAGTSTADDVLALFREAAGSTGYTYEVEKPTQTQSDQKSLIIRIPGTKTVDEIVVLGAHLDSINRATTGSAPGADDDASGIATMVEIFRVLAANNKRFSRTIEFHAYAAEEVGLIGSKTIAADYAERDVKVVSMVQMDMNSYHQDPNRQTIYLVKNDTNKNLTRSLKSYLNSYLDGDYEEKQLSAGTSDHKAWTDRGFAAAFPFEDPDHYNANLHTPNDTLKNVNNLLLSERFAKLGLAYMSHYAGLSDLVDAAADFDVAEYFAKLSSDLGIAVVTDEDSEDNYFLSVSTDPAAVKRVEICRISSSSDPECAEERSTLEALTDAKSRGRFSEASSMSFNNGDYYRILGYGPDDQLVAMRQIVLKKQ